MLQKKIFYYITLNHIFKIHNMSLLQDKFFEELKEIDKSIYYFQLFITQ